MSDGFRRSQRVYFAATLCLTLVSAPIFRGAAGYQQAPVPEGTAYRLDGDAAPTIDGLLDEPIWRRAASVTDLRQLEPLEGEPASERTEVWIAYDATTLYVGVAAHDSEPDRVIARLLQRDQLMTSSFEGEPEFAGDDAIALLFDPFDDHRNGVIFATNPNGAEFDALLTDEGREFNIDWRGVWSVAAERTPAGWSAEFAIPFRSLRFPANATEPWGFNVYRMIRRKNEEVLWSSWSRANEGFSRVSRAGHIHGLDSLTRPNVNMEVKPYVLTGLEQDRDSLLLDPPLDAGEVLDVGLDLKYEIRPGLLLDATLNTDFAQVEADDEQVNLTRFSLFFPEKRDFFLENAGIFEMGWRSFFEPPPFLLFFSRQIGLTEDGTIPVLGGLRLTGRVGNHTVGLLNVVTDEALGEPRTNFAVARVTRDIGASNYVGAMVTDRRATGGSNTAGGVDWSFWPTSAFNVQGFAAATQTTGDGGDGAAWRLGLDYQTDVFGVQANHLGVTDEANAEMGFVTRTDIVRNQAIMRFTARPRVLGLRKVDVYWDNRLQTHLDGTIQDWTLGPAINPEWNTGDAVAVFYQPGFTRLDEEFEIGDDVLVPPGDYDADQWGWFANTSPNRPLVLSTTGFFWDIYDGELATVTVDLTAKPTANLSATLGLTHNRVDVPDGAFSADVLRARLAYAFSTQLTANALIQYNDEEDLLSANVRINFIHRPGSDLFIVLNEERGDARSLAYVQNRTAVVKLTYLARL